MPARPDIRIGVDTGGTFTDLVLVDERGALCASHKRLSTPDDPARAVIEGIDHLLAQAQHPPRSAHAPRVVHGSTVATNALLERTETRTALIATAGFEDTLAIARQDRPELYALVPRRPEPPIPTERCFGVRERLGHDGRVIEPMRDTECHALIEKLRQLDADSVAVCLLHSYANPAHERSVGDALRHAFGNALHVTLSHELLPEYREYERTATCAINAVVAPRMVRYLDRLSNELGEDRLRIMASHGGTLPPRAVRDAPVRTTLSGPAGGVVGAAAVAELAGIKRIITLDMGGTSTDVALCDDGPTHTTESEAGGLPVRLPSVDMHTVGAGGGSIAWLDPGGALRVGPRSAGAEPGPACYGRQRGEPEATVTDAHVVLGHIPLDQPLGEDLRLDRERAMEAVSRIADHAQLEPMDAALGILRVVETTMARAVQRISLERGRDPRAYTLVPFGGAGGLHACALAERLGMTRVLVPGEPGVLSALGMLGAPARHAFSQGMLLRLEPRERGYDDPMTLPALREALEALRQRADAAAREEGIEADERVDERSVDLRYLGQSYEINVPLDAGACIERFLAEHDRLYGYVAPEKPIEVVAVRWRVSGPSQPVTLPTLVERETPLRRREARDVPVYDGAYTRPWRHVARTALCAGDRFDTPTIVSEYSATTLMPHGWRMHVNAHGQLLLERENEATGHIMERADDTRAG